MYYVTDSYMPPNSKDLFETKEAAIEASELEASKDWEGRYYMVTELVTVLKAEIPTNPVKCFDVSELNSTTLLENLKEI